MAEPLKVRGVPTVAWYGPLALTVGTTFETVTDAVAMVLAESSSSTRSATVNTPSLR